MGGGDIDGEGLSGKGGFDFWKALFDEDASHGAREIFLRGMREDEERLEGHASHAFKECGVQGDLVAEFEECFSGEGAVGCEYAEGDAMSHGLDLQFIGDAASEVVDGFVAPVEDDLRSGVGEGMAKEFVVRWPCDDGDMVRELWCDLSQCGEEKSSGGSFVLGASNEAGDSGGDGEEDGFDGRRGDGSGEDVDDDFGRPQVSQGGAPRIGLEAVFVGFWAELIVEERRQAGCADQF